MKLCTIVGARPQFIKAATVSRAIRENGAVHEVLIHTGQHYDKDMSENFFEELDIPKPSHHLGIGGGSHGQMTGRQLEKIEEVFLQERPDWVLVYGDTNSTLAGALAAVKLHIPVAHVEAGLRSFNRKMPEEINRILADHSSSLLFAPTSTAVENLRAEGITGDSVRLVGDVMFDAVLHYRHLARRPAWFDEKELSLGGFVLCTIHRAENTDDAHRLSGILQGVGAAGSPVILPLHPRTRRRIDEGGLNVPGNVRLVPPVGYLEMCWLEANCRIVATDSGGVQKEAFFHGKPCITLRDETEWIELVNHGVNILVGADATAISNALHRDWNLMDSPALYGDGDAAGAILTALNGALP